MNEKPWTYDESSMSIDYIPCVLRDNCWRPLGTHYSRKTPGEARKALDKYLRITEHIHKQHPDFVESPIMDTRIVERITFVSTQWKEVTE